MRKILKVTFLIAMTFFISLAPTAWYARGSGRQSVYMPRSPRSAPKGRPAKVKKNNRAHAKGKKGKRRLDAQKIRDAKAPKTDKIGLETGSGKGKARRKRRPAKRGNRVSPVRAQNVVCTCVKRCTCGEVSDLDSCDCSRAHLKR